MYLKKKNTYLLKEKYSQRYFGYTSPMDHQSAVCSALPWHVFSWQWLTLKSWSKLWKYPAHMVEIHPEV